MEQKIIELEFPKFYYSRRLIELLKHLINSTIIDYIEQMIEA